ncbi:HEAT repeat domain-containing protein [Dyadobacter frigoris]|uniref:HEAT repeat domain-containing protein n=1 Tax=Dyadobacter frigoris TaxID=2576211 RepID=A0A4U6D123_9BACT|nr:HEAT repeat domain-containing protein [Dyadobacter frigoris]TKT87474.1 HEAT repeat domain-containing protein [Dyadobacter frigoris]GLU52274.1 hypothetical protein Dfri01_17350 [Dyadobacter frigoris]
MTCEHTKAQFTDWLNKDPADPERIRIDKHLAECPECQEEFASSKQLWEMMGQVKVEVPTEKMRVNFNAMLGEFKETVRTKDKYSLDNLIDAIRQFVLPQWTIQLTFSLLLVGLGWIIGFRMNRSEHAETAYTQQIDTLATQIQEMRQTMMLALIENPSATERLRAVSYTNDITDANDKVIDALFSTLDNDPNVNVRLVTLEAITQFAADPLVREKLVQSLAQQDSPMVQVALADVMVKLQEKRSIKTFRKMLRQENLNELVKNKIEQTIKDLS